MHTVFRSLGLFLSVLSDTASATTQFAFRLQFESANMRSLQFIYCGVRAAGSSRKDFKFQSNQTCAHTGIVHNDEFNRPAAAALVSFFLPSSFPLSFSLSLFLMSLARTPWSLCDRFNSRSPSALPPDPVLVQPKNLKMENEWL